MMNSAYYLRIEAVNLAHFVYDTNDLATVRGGALLLLRAPARLEHSLRDRGYAPERITDAASHAIWKVTPPQPVSADDLAREAEAFFRDSDRGMLQHATILAAAAPSEGDFADIYQQLLGTIRHRQMQAASLAIPDWNNNRSLNPCGEDHLRAANGRDFYGSRGEKLSLATAARREEGREARQDLYGDELHLADLADGRIKALRFTDDLEALAADKRRGNLDGKTAVFYADGNALGAFYRDYCGSEPVLKAASNTLKQKRAELLRALLESANAGETWKTDDGRLRLETLLWGGDELIWVAPAWVGWEMLTLFYAASADWTIEGRDEHGRTVSKEITHGAGLVFCHRNAPITRVIHLAKELAEDAKTRRKELKDAGVTERLAGNLFGCEVLESFDHLGVGLEEARARRSPPRTARGDLRRHFIFSGGQAAGIHDAVRLLHAQDFPRSQLHDVVQLLLEGAAPDDPRVRRVLTFIEQKHGAALDALRAFRQALRTGREPSAPADEATEFVSAFAGDWSMWLHLDEWWDYAAPAA